MSQRADRFIRIQQVEREYLYARMAIALLEEHINEATDFARERELSLPEFHALDRNLEKTYIIRLYAEFESALRAYWADWLRRTSHPRMHEMLYSLAAQHHVTRDVYDATDAVRRFRNSLVHEESAQAKPFTIASCRHYLCSFLGFMSKNW